MTIPQAKPGSRAQVQCDRILDAAEDCFIRYGFHAASMANICETAEMSPGLVYRYFENKSAIIKAIIGRQLKILRSDIVELLKSEDPISMIVEVFKIRADRNHDRMNPVLYLELIAEASRDSDIAEMVDLTDAVCESGFHSLIEKLALIEGNNLTEDQLKTNEFALRCFLDGLVIRTMRHSDTDPILIERALVLFTRRMLTPS